ncbi:MAG TPA: Holliday junction branch migration protein RuvA [Verrucomicrobiales bacterium]|nr:Holliday junction branch migration protein RuvA [Verrucomicrobiales bacterium]|tara:strand:+ start:166 stop:768 length:603 start_codon:yes stop_codon:yes gene_type:complete
MIAFLKGILIEALPTQVVIDVNGVGYEVLIPLSSFEKLPQPGGELTLLTHLAIRDDAHILYGFSTETERDLFRQLIRHVTGIGPKIALNVLSGTTPASFRAAVSNGDVKALSGISGVGKKTAERIVVELKDKLGDPELGELNGVKSASIEDQKIADAVAALEALGSKPKDAQEAIRMAITMLGPDKPVDELVRAALKKSK